MNNTFNGLMNKVGIAEDITHEFKYRSREITKMKTQRGKWQKKNTETKEHLKYEKQYHMISLNWIMESQRKKEIKLGKRNVEEII